MAISYSYQGHCYASSTDAFYAFIASYPMVDQNTITYIYTAQVAEPFIYVTFGVVTIATGNVATRKGTYFPLTQCPAGNVDSGPYDYAHGAAIWAFAVVFVIGVYIATKPAGLLLKAIKWW